MIIIATCEECKKNIHFDYDRCEACSSKNLLRREKGKYYFQGQAFTKNKWYQKMANYLRIEKDEVILRRTPDEIRIEYIKAFVLKNIKKTTFLVLILPCILLLGLSLTLLWGGQFYQENANFVNSNQFIFIIFLAGMFFILGNGLLVKIIIMQEKVIMLGNDKKTKLTHLSKKQYQGIIDVFKKE